ncbi:ABC transporter ATP-binding protein [Roseibacillus ishigakijimensis]|uniref:ABC transporter ATP-binding protein n=1 Tax=Roseibacillus ishigakijimensis TaxID=454146 RepID=A0A934VLI1_9BACT|nr:ABC transporter ATP-binding protein [Roseibacillus ishigakijimensis]MBK1834709.1 ABC transporter ATP-binding protein [Roseibacillus ishigakijimensis]
MNELVKFEEVGVSFGRVPALSGATFSVPKGSVTTLLGANGAGKSTAMRAALNLVKANRGQVTVLGQPARRIGPRELRKIGYVAEGMEMPGWMSVRAYLDWCRPMYPGWDLALEKKLAAMFALPSDRLLKNLSRGQRMKAALLSVLPYRPELLLLDEPFSGLDPLVRDDLTRSILELCEQESWGVLISTHDIAEVEQLADRVVIMKLGRVILEDDREALLERWRRVELLVGDDWEAPARYPVEWLGLSRMGLVVRFYESDYEAGRFAEKLSQYFPGGADVATQRVSLREVLATLAKSGQVEVGP